jgi:outer membrane protein OmpA-like peptidoglycan-associated protein
MGTQWLRSALASMILLAAGCAPKKVPPPPAPPAPAAAPQPKQNLVVLLADPEGKPSAITVTNPAGTQTLSEPNQAIHVERSDVAPTPPFNMDSAEVRRIFGPTLDVLPLPEVLVTLYFGGDSEVLNDASQAKIPDILKAIQERHSTAITVIGHTDTTATPAYNYELGMRRARGVAAILRASGVEDSSLLVDSHGESDQAVKTDRGKSEPRNRRVEVIVR